MAGTEQFREVFMKKILEYTAGLKEISSGSKKDAKDYSDKVLQYPEDDDAKHYS